MSNNVSVSLAVWRINSTEEEFLLQKFQGERVHSRNESVKTGGGGVVPLSVALIYIMKNMNDTKPNSKTNSS